MTILQSYFNYFVKYSGVENWKWYIGLAEWVDIAQNIKKEVGYAVLNNLQAPLMPAEFVNILMKNSNNEINSQSSFWKRYLFEQNNALGNISQGVIWDTQTNPHKTAIEANLSDGVLIDLLQKNIQDAEIMISGLLDVGVIRTYEAAKFRLLRALFPNAFTALDAPNKLSRLLNSIDLKLGIQINGSIIDKHQQLMTAVVGNSYIKQIFFWELYYMLENKLNLKKAIVYYGAPGTGKTFKAKERAKRIIDEHRIKVGKAIHTEESKYHIKTVQFHPSYSYEDFMEGIRPTADGKLSLFNGTFKEFCKKEGCKEIALYKDNGFLKNPNFKTKEYDFSQIKVSELSDIQKNILNVPKGLATGITIEGIIEPALFIIDEINRAELSRVFGELMYSLEYRGYNGKIKTQYAYLNKDENANSVYFWENGEDWFFIPQNIFIIGTMNNIDRSVDSFDFALRRRFKWEEVQPNYDVISTVLLDKEWDVNIVDNLKESLKKLNDEIEKVELLGKDYLIGHSYVLELKKLDKDAFGTAEETKQFLWDEFIKPLMEEYLRGLGDAKKAKEILKSFKESFGLT
jgi:AAA domain (dynein-related subfamily)